MLLSMIYCIGPVSGCHINPAITLGQMIGYIGHPQWKKKTIMGLCMIFGQFAGALAGAAAVWMLGNDSQNDLLFPKTTILCPPAANPTYQKHLCDPKGRTIQIFFTEALMTFMFVSTILSLVYNSLENKLAAGIVGTLSLYCGVVGASSITGGALNPAVGMAL